MKIYYPKKLLLFPLFMGVSWTLLSIFNLLIGNWTIASYGGVATAIFGWLGYFYFRFVPYLEIKNGKLTKNAIFSKSIPLTDIKKLKNYAGDITLTSGDRQLIIEGQLLSQQEKMALEEELCHYANAA